MSASARADAGLGPRIAELHADVERCAELAGLHHVDEAALAAPGITRLRAGRGFRYRTPDGRPLRDQGQRQRIAELAIPPAWRDVWISPDPDGHIAALGHDDRGRTQYLYDERWQQVRSLLNSYRLIGFAESLPAIRDHVSRQLRRRTLDRDRVTAAMVRILDLTAIRIGNEVYAEENDSFGLSTLTRRHVAVTGDSIRLTFPAKSGKRADTTLEDRSVARVLEQLQSQRSRRLFTIDRRAVTSDEVNATLHEWTGAHVTAKDFRTWRGTLTAFVELERAERAERVEAAESVGAADRDRAVVHAMDAAAELLGNTRAVVRANYVHPHLISTFLDGSFASVLAASRTPRTARLDPAERRLLGLLRALWQHQPELRPGPRPRLRA